MAQIQPKYYWDACLFIAWLKDEKRKPGEMEGLAEVVSMIDRKDVVLITSVVSKTEVLESTLIKNAINFLKNCAIWPPLCAWKMAKQWTAPRWSSLF